MSFEKGGGQNQNFKTTRDAKQGQYGICDSDINFLKIARFELFYKSQVFTIQYRVASTGPVLAGIGTEDRMTVFNWYRYRPVGHSDRPQCSSGGSGGGGVGSGRGSGILSLRMILSA